MTTQEINQNFTKTVAVWENALDNYTHTLFAMRPDEESWAVGQVCQHLIGSTKRIFLVIEKCLAGDNNEHEQKTEAGEKAFAANILSEVKVKVPITLQATPQQPESKQYVKHEFEELKINFAKLSEVVNKSQSKGKEKHPVLGFMNAKEWLQTAEMHFRHHLKQKESIDTFLKANLAK
jgi:hypothetical protein